MKFLFLDSSGVLREGVLPNEADRVSFGVQWHQELRPITQTEVDYGMIELPDCPIDNSVYLTVSGATQLEGIDFEIQRIAGICKVVFLNDLINGGISELTEGDLLHIRFAIENPTETIKFKKETFILQSNDIQNQFVIIDGKPTGYVEKVMAPGLTFTPGFDYTLEDVGTVTRVVFANDFSENGLCPLSEGDILQVSYAVLNY